LPVEQLLTKGNLFRVPLLYFSKTLTDMNLSALTAVIVISLLGGGTQKYYTHYLLGTAINSFMLFAFYFLWYIPVLSKHTILVFSPIALSVFFLVKEIYQLKTE
jgi:hypothetical protein